MARVTQCDICGKIDPCYTTLLQDGNKIYYHVTDALSLDAPSKDVCTKCLIKLLKETLKEDKG